MGDKNKKKMDHFLMAKKKIKKVLFPTKRFEAPDRINKLVQIDFFQTFFQKIFTYEAPSNMNFNKNYKKLRSK